MSALASCWSTSQWWCDGGPGKGLYRARHRALALALITLWAVLMMDGVACWRKPTGLATGVFVLFAAMVVLAVWAARERERLANC